MAKIEIQSNIKLGLQEILDGIAQLEAKDIEIFLKEVTQILAQKQQPNKNKEAQLIKKIKIIYPPKLNKRYQVLTSKMDEGNLSEKEQQELIELSHQFEKLDAQRLQYLLELAQLRNQPLEKLLQEFSISSPPSTHA